MQNVRRQFMVRVTSTIAAIALGSILTAGCTDSGERGFKSSRPELMHELKIALDRSGVPYREESGYIKYDAKDEEFFASVLEEVEESVSGGVSVRYDDAASRKYHKQLLRSEGIKYRIEYKSGDEWIRWYPVNETQQSEIELKVAEKYFESSNAK